MELQREDSENIRITNGQSFYKTNECGFTGVTNMAEWSSHKGISSELLTVGFFSALSPLACRSYILDTIYYFTKKTIFNGGETYRLKKKKTQTSNHVELVEFLVTVPYH